MKTRIISAVVAVIALIAIYAYGRTYGLYVVCSIVALGCALEYIRLVFKTDETPKHIRVFFGLTTAGIFGAVLMSDGAGLLTFTLGAVVYLAMTMMTIEKREDLDSALYLQSMGLLGFLYCGLVPALATRLLHLDQGALWLFSLLAIVFSGDTCAYLVGRQFGKTRLLEAVSPKKTMEGAMGGLIGSGIAGFAVSFLLPNQSPLIFTAAALVVGAFAQIGDLFESLLKRVADVKDSGSIMPGHGGILDRVDGVYFAAPVYFVLVRFLTH